MKKGIIFLVPYLFCIIFLVDLGALLTRDGSEVLSVNLKHIPGPTHKISRNLCAKPSCEIGNTEFYVTLNPLFWPVKAFNSRGNNNSIYFAPHILVSKHFKAIAAHELGHIVKNTSDQCEADRFAAELIGSRKEVIDALVDVAGLKHDDPRIAMLSK